MNIRRHQPFEKMNKTFFSNSKNKLLAEVIKTTFLKIRQILYNIKFAEINFFKNRYIKNSKIKILVSFSCLPVF